MELPENYKEEMKALLKEEYEAYEDSLSGNPAHGVRLNPLKVPKGQRKAVLARLQVNAGESVAWSDSVGYYYEEGIGLSRHPYYHGGLYYLQEPSAMAPAALLPVTPGDRILDLCAAPGGKSTQLGARLSGSGLLLSNDVSASRAKGLLKNLELFGIGNCMVSSEEPEKLRSCFPDYFDKILVDAPCSGEGMFRREPSMVKSWMDRGPDYYVPIQRDILFAACGMLKPGGMLLYSTCTFSKAEDEENVEWLLKEVPQMEQVVLEPVHGFSQGFDGASVRLFPWKLKGEGHFAALLRKKGEGTAPEGCFVDTEKMEKTNTRFLKGREAFSDFLKLITKPVSREGYFWEREGQIYLLPIPKEELPSIRFLRTGLFLGTLKKNRFEPSQALAMYLKKDEFANGSDFSSEDMRTVKYLKGETIEVSEKDVWGGEGWCLVCTDGYPLGFAKRNRMTLKNKYYPGWRWQ